MNESGGVRKLLSQVLRIFIDTVAANYRKRLADRGTSNGKHGAVAVIQRANSDLRITLTFTRSFSTDCTPAPPRRCMARGP
jgi:hypothetical protein